MEIDIKQKRKESLKKASENVSTLVRQLAFAGIAIIWVVKDGSVNIFRQNILLLLSMFSIVLSVAFELTHYVIEIVSNKYYIEKTDRPIPKIYSTMAWNMWWMKVLLIILSYTFIGIYLAEQIIAK